MTGAVDLLVVGAGAKAAAVAARVHSINRLGLGPIRLRIVEEVEPAASWSGINGMTSGDEHLAITPYKDIGFPYESHLTLGERGTAIDAELTRFSWQHFLIDSGGYARWLNAGMPSVRHRDYGRYLTWVLQRATDGVETVRGRVTQIDLRSGEDGPEWSVAAESPSGPEHHRGRALMLTGPGSHRYLSHDRDAAGRLLHCSDHRSAFAALPEDGPCEVGIVGGGESALSCIVFLRRFRPNAHLTVYTTATPLSRGESFLENRVYSNPDSIGWEGLSVADRRAFIHHTDRGVFGPASLELISHDDGVDFVIGRVDHVSATTDGLRLDYVAPSGPASADHDFVANCTGFDFVAQIQAWLSDDARHEIERQVGPVWDPERLDLAFGRELEVAELRPRLHVPGLAAVSQGPGFANLGCLGLLAGRVLHTYVVDEAAEGRERTVA